MGKRTQSEVVVVTGASAGIGRAVARAFAESGARVGLLARGREGLESARRDVEERGGQALVLHADVADYSQVESAAAKVEKEFGPIDIWVNNAMVTVYAPVKETSPEEYRRVTEVTYLGYVNGTLAALKRMQPRNKGVIVQVGSGAAYRSFPLQSAYCGAKHAIRGFTDSLRSELIHDRSAVKVTMVQLPAVNTPQFGWARNRMERQARPMAPVYQPEGAAKAVVWAARHPRRETLVGMPTVLGVELNKMFPGLLDRFLAKRAYQAEQYDGQREAGQPDNLWRPLRGDYGAHGIFDQEARGKSGELWISRNRDWLFPLAAGALGAAGAVWMGRSGS